MRISDQHRTKSGACALRVLSRRRARCKALTEATSACCCIARQQIAKTCSGWRGGTSPAQRQAHFCGCESGAGLVASIDCASLAILICQRGAQRRSTSTFGVTGVAAPETGALAVPTLFAASKSDVLVLPGVDLPSRSCCVDAPEGSLGPVAVADVPSSSARSKSDFWQRLRR